MPAFGPVIPGESDLSVQYSDLQQAVVLITGWDTDPNAWQANETPQFAQVLKAAMQRCYGAHPWSFLNVSVPWQMVPGEDTYDLPDDFASMEGPLYFQGDYVNQPPIKKASLGMVWQTRDLIRNGRPQYYAIEPLPQTGENIGQRYGIHFDLRPAAPYQIRAQYRVNPYLLSATRKYPVGGEFFAQCLRLAVQAQTELDLKDGPDKYEAQFQKILAETIAEDLRRGPQYLGRNRARQSSNYSATRMLPVSGIFYNGNAVE